MSNFTPALTTSSHDTPSVVAEDDPFLSTPTVAEDISGVSSAFMFPCRSFEIEHYTNIKDVVPEWDDDEVDEIMVLSSKSKMPKSLSVIFEGKEAHIPSDASFQNLRCLTTPTLTSKVCLAKHILSEKLYAVKTFSKSAISYDTPTLEQAMKEQMMLRLLTQMEVRFVLKLRWSFQDEKAMHLVTDYCDYGDLKIQIERIGPLQPYCVRIYAAELADALSSLHSSGINHRSIRPEHIFLDSTGHILLSGFSRSSVTCPNSPQTGSSLSLANAFSDRRGPLSEIDEWSSPERVLGWSQDCAVDCWAFGLMLVFMLTGRHAFLRDQGAPPHLRTLEAMILHHTIDLEAVEAGARNLASWCLQRNARLRPAADEIRAHSYFEDLDWDRLRDKGYPVALPKEQQSSQEDLTEIPESETLRGVHIAGFNYAYEEVQEQSRVDLLSDDDFVASGEEEKPTNDTSLMTSASEEDRTKLNATQEDARALSGKRNTYATLDSNYVTPAGSFTSNTNSANSRTPSTALYSCTSFGELRDFSKADDNKDAGVNMLSAALPPADSGGDDFQSNAANRPAAARGTASQSDCLSTSGTISEDHIRGESEPARPPSILMRRDTTNTVFSTSSRNTNRPESSLGGARGLRVRKYASLNFDLDTIVSLDLDFDRENDDNNLDSSSRGNALSGSGFVLGSSAGRPRSLATSRRVSFVDTLNADTSITSASALLSGSSPLKPDAQPYTAPIGGPSSPWSLKNLNHFKFTSPTQASAASVNAQNRLKKKPRASSTPVLPLLTTPRLQEKVDLPAGLQQIGLGIGYTHTRPLGAPLPTPTAEQRQDKDKTVAALPSTARRNISSIGTANAMQRCSAIFANLALGRHHAQAGRASGRGQNQADALAERMSEESDALEAVMREMYGASWNAESNSGYGYASAIGSMAVGASGTSTRKPGRVYSVPGMSGLTSTVPRNMQAGNSTLRLVEPVPTKEV